MKKVRIPTQRGLTRRGLLAGAAGLLAACGPRKGTRFPGFAFIANQAGRTVAAIDLEKFAVSRQIGMDGAPALVLPHAKRRAAYVLCPEAGVVAEIEAARLKVTRKARLGGPAVAMCLDAEQRSLWVLQERALVEVALERMSAGRRIPLPAAASDFDLHENGSAAVVFPQQHRAGIFQLKSGRTSAMLDAGANPVFARFRSDGKVVLIADRASRMLLVGDPVSGRTVVRLPLPLEPAQSSFSPDRGQLFISGPGMDAVTIVYPYETEVAETVLAGERPGALAVTPSYLLVANPTAARLTVLDVVTRKLAAVVPVGEEPGAIVMTPDLQYALVLNRKSGDVAVVRLAAFTERSHKTNPPPLFTMIPVGPRPVSGAVVAV